MKKFNKLPPTNLLGRYVKGRQLNVYFNASSVSELIALMRTLKSDHLLDFQVRLSSNYIEHHNQKMDAVLNRDILKPRKLGFVEVGKPTINSSLVATPLDRKKLNDVLAKLTHGEIEEYFEFKITNLDRERLAQMVKPSSKKEVYGEATYQSLKIREGEVTYENEPIHMTFKEQEVLRMLIEKAERTVGHDELESNPDIISADIKTDPRIHVSKLISQVRLKLKKPTRQNCIQNNRENGWTLLIK